MGEQQISVTVGGYVLRLSNLEKVLYPEAGFTKGEVIDYYVSVAPALLPRLAGRPVTLRRYPNGADTEGFFEKHASRHAPDWVGTVVLPDRHGRRGHTSTEYVLIEDVAALVWVANLAALELHVPQWTIDGEDLPTPPDLLVFDLDPGPGTDIVDCCRVAELIRAALAEDGLTATPKTSGSKGLQLYAPITVTDSMRPVEYAKALAGRLARAHGELVTATMAKVVRPGKVFIDWSQNNPAKTTIAPYSLRARPRPTVSTPVTWAEVAACRTAADLTFTAPQVKQRLTELGDLLAGLPSDPQSL